MDEIVIIIIGLLGAIIGYFIKYFLDKKHMLFNSSSNIKRENYKKFVSIIIDIFKAVKDKKKNKTVDVISEIYDFYKDYLLFAGPSVIRSFGECMQLLYRYNKIENKEDNKEIFKLLSGFGKVFLDMREELGLKNKKLGDNGLLLWRPIITDYDEIMKELNINQKKNGWLFAIIARLKFWSGRIKLMRLTRK